MLPQAGTDNVIDFDTNTTQPSYTYALEFESQRVRGYTDNRDALRQAIYLIIGTERYYYVIYSWNYGAELRDLIGQPVSYVLAEIKRRVEEALLQDDRITGITDWSFEVQGKKVHAKFMAHTIYGDIPIEKEVDL